MRVEYYAIILLVAVAVIPEIILPIWKWLRQRSDQVVPALPIAVAAGATDAFLQKEWEVSVKTQMHFNDMIMRIRALGVTGVTTAFGAAAVVYGQYPDRMIEVAGVDDAVHVASLIIVAGLTFWAAIVVLDYYYYFKLLIGAVAHTYRFDDANFTLPAAGHFRAYGLSRRISGAIGPPGFSTYVIRAFYGMVYAAGVVYLHVLVEGAP